MASAIARGQCSATHFISTDVGLLAPSSSSFGRLLTVENYLPDTKVTNKITFKI